MKWERIQLLCIENLIWILIPITFIGFSVLQPAFFTLNSVHFILQEAAIVGLLALGLGICMLAGDFDVSLAQIAGLSAVTVCWLSKYTSLSWFWILLIPLGIGLAIGTFQGVLIGKRRMNAFLITLAGWMIWHSVKGYVAAGHNFWIRVPEIIFLGRARIMGGLFVSSVVFIGLILLIWFFVKYTRKGTGIYATGTSEETTRRLGINTGNIKLLVHVLAGILAGLCGILYVGFNNGFVQPLVADGDIFKAFIAVAIAGISITGGRGNLLHILGGAILYSIIRYGVFSMGVGWQLAEYIIPGGLCLVAIILLHRLDVFRDRIISRIYKA